MMPRARIDNADGRHREWRSTIIPRYQRRTGRVDEAILGVYVSGANTHRLLGALSPLLRRLVGWSDLTALTQPSEAA
ncbi:hypothetical protein IMX07_02735 [bacterium]|nr:hypothetical protein [bacterium]